MLTGGTLFEELGFYYVGPIDGHNLDHLLPVLRNVREAEESRADPGARGHPEGQGLRAGRGSGRQVHGVSASSTSVTGEQAKAPPGPPSYTKVFADALIARGRGATSDRRDHRGDAVGHRARPLRQALSRRAASTSASPSSTR